MKEKACHIEVMNISSMRWNRTIEVTLLNRATNKPEKLSIDLPRDSLDKVKDAIRKELANMKVQAGGDVWIQNMGGLLTQEEKEDQEISELEEQKNRENE